MKSHLPIVYGRRLLIALCALLAIARPLPASAADWPPQHMKGLPADYLQRLHDSLTAVASHLDRGNRRAATSDPSILWVRYGTGALALGQRVAEINAFFESDKFTWLSNDKFGFSLFSTEYMRLYGLMNQRTGVMKGPLSRAAQDNFEKQMWRVAKANSKLAEARRGVRELEGSENHHLSSKICDLLAAQFLRNIPPYASQRYDDGSTAAEQYEARRDYFLAWFDERAKRGQFIEAASPSYQPDSINAIFNLRDFAEDPVLRMKAEMYLDLTYANIAEETLLTTRGGPKSRVKVGHEYDAGACDRGYDVIFNAPGRQFVALGDATRATSNYYPPPAIVNLARDTSTRGDYAFAKRWPGPLSQGREASTESGASPSLWRTLDPEKSVLRHGFATPDYVIGSAALDPSWIEDASMGFRWQGIVFASNPLARIGFEVEPAKTKDWHGFNPFFSAQDRNVLITQQWAPVPPNPAAAHPAHLRIYFSPALDEVHESGGWIFAKAGNAFTALRIVTGGYTWTLPWRRGDSLKEKSFVKLNAADAPVIMIANRAADTRNDFSAFQAAVKSQPIRCADGVLHFATLEFRGAAAPAQINGQPVNLAPPRGYDSPFIRSDWASGLIHIRKGNETVILDFRDPKNPKKTVGAPVTAEFPAGAGNDRPIDFI